MKKIVKHALSVAFGWLLAIPVLAGDGVQTIIKGTVQGTAVKSVFLYKRDAMRGFNKTDSVEADGQFQFALNLKESGFYVIAPDANNNERIEMYLKPGDLITMKMVNDRFIMSGKGSELNQFLYDLTLKYPYKGTESEFTQVYNNRVSAINGSSNEEVVRNKALLLGNAQGEYLDNVFGRVVDYKSHGGAEDMMSANFSDLSLRLVPEIMIHPKWRETVTEFMYTKLRAGNLKIRKVNSWIADFGNAIENPKLREEFVMALIDYSASNGDLSLNNEIKEALPLIKDPKNLARLSGLKSRLAMNTKGYLSAPVGTAMNSYSFHDLNGKQINISDFKGKYLFIDIWNTGCRPCIAEMPFLHKMEQEMKGQAIVFLSISCDSNKEQWKGFLQKHNQTDEHQLIMEKKDPFFEKIGRSGIPRFVILDKEGKMVNNNCCKRPSNPLLKIYLNELLAQ